MSRVECASDPLDLLELETWVQRQPDPDLTIRCNGSFLCLTHGGECSFTVEWRRTDDLSADLHLAALRLAALTSQPI